MISDKHIKWGLWGIVAIALLTSMWVGAKRLHFEAANPTVNLAMSNAEINRLSVLGGVPRSELLAKLKHEIQISAVAVEEQTIRDYIESGRLTLLKGSEIMNLYRVGHVNRYVLTNLYKKVKVKPEYFYLIIEKEEDYEHIRDFLTAEFGRDNVKRIGELNILEILDEKEDLLTIGLGLSKDVITELKGYGFTILPRLQNSSRLSKRIINLKFKTLEDLSDHEPILFNGKSALGYPSSLNDVQQRMDEKAFRLGVIEFANQFGVRKLALADPLSVVRVHSIPESKMESISIEKAIARYRRAAKERGIHVLFIHPFFTTRVGDNVMDVNVLYFNRLKTHLENHGFVLSPTIGHYDNTYTGATPWEIALISLGVFVILFLLIHHYLPLTYRRVAIGVGSLCVIFYFFQLLGYGAYWNMWVAILAAIVFPTYAIVSQFYYVNNTHGIRALHWQAALVYLFKVVGITLAGVLCIVGLLSGPEYLLGIIRFSGVKLSFIIPLLLVWIFFFLHPYRLSSIYHVFRRLLISPVKTSALLAVVACLLFVFVYILRSGNYLTIHIPVIEDSMREFLENNLAIRPRTKEFLIGYPMLFIGFLFADRTISKQWIWFVNGLGLVALVSLVNSFCHFHTPLFISFYRFLLGLGLGLIVALIYIVGAAGVRFFFKRLMD